MVTNASGQVQTCPMCDGTGKAYIPGLFYVYSIIIALTALQQLQQSISILNAPFKWIFATAVSTGAFTVQLQDAKNQRQFFNQAVDSRLVFGTAQHLFPVLNPYTFDQNGAIQITVTDTSNANNSVQLGFIGVQLIQSVQSSN